MARHSLSSATMPSSTATPEAANQIDNQPTAANQAKRGLLSRLRQKLGL
ncbi:hypothetical protein [Psychrobacter urativorans]|nr:hypothetical protein [Psychrobacter urativorans]